MSKDIEIISKSVSNKIHIEKKKIQRKKKIQDSDTDIIIKNKLWNGSELELQPQYMVKALARFKFSNKILNFTTIKTMKEMNKTLQLSHAEFRKYRNKIIKQRSTDFFNKHERSLSNWKLLIHSWLQTDGHYGIDSLAYLYPIPVYLEHCLMVVLNENDYGDCGKFVLDKRMPEILNDGSLFSDQWGYEKLYIHIQYYYN